MLVGSTDRVLVSLSQSDANNTEATILKQEKPARGRSRRRQDADVEEAAPAPAAPSALEAATSALPPAVGSSSAAAGLAQQQSGRVHSIHIRCACVRMRETVKPCVCTGAWACIGIRMHVHVEYSFPFANAYCGLRVKVSLC